MKRAAKPEGNEAQWLKGVRAYLHGLIVLVAVLGAMTARAEGRLRPTWSLDFRSVFDNREGDKTYTDADTYFFTQLTPEVGLRFTDKDRISGGIVWTQPVGYDWNGKRVTPVLYYAREGRWGGAVGIFPKTLLHEELPNFLESDSLDYFQRNIRGMLLSYNGERAYVDLFLDWRQRRTETEREAFNIVLHGRWQPSRVIVGGYAMMNHFALTRHAGDDEHIVDNFLVNPYVGYDFGGMTRLDSLAVRGGALMTIERNRAGDAWKAPAGVWLDVTARWRWLELRNTFYAGGRLFPSYTEHGWRLYQGEPYYSSDLYNRTDLSAHIVRNRYVELDASLKFNVTRDAFMFYQCVNLRVFLNNRNISFAPKPTL